MNQTPVRLIVEGPESSLKEYGLFFVQSELGFNPYKIGPMKTVQEYVEAYQHAPDQSIVTHTHIQHSVNDQMSKGVSPFTPPEKTTLDEALEKAGCIVLLLDPDSSTQLSREWMLYMLETKYLSVSRVDSFTSLKRVVDQLKKEGRNA